jgi:nitroreductase
MSAPLRAEELPMSTLTDIALLDCLAWRYAVKRFDRDRRIPEEDWQALEQALVLSPSSYGLQPYHLVVVTEPALRRRLRDASFGQPQVTDCDHLAVFATRTIDHQAIDGYLARIAEVRGQQPQALAKLRQIMVDDLIAGPRNAWIAHWAARQAYLALGNLLTCAAVLGIDACPMEGFDPTAYDEILGLPARGMHAVVQCALGYRSGDDRHAAEPKVRLPATALIEHR